MNYNKLYKRLISGLKKRQKDVKIGEVHHILPRSLGGSDVKSNLVKITPREHFILHKVLWKIHGKGPMAQAFVFMSDLNKITNGRAYEEAKAQVKSSSHKRKQWDWIDNRLINDKTGEIVEINEKFTLGDFAKSGKTIDARCKNTVLVMRGFLASARGWRLLPQFRSKMKFKPGWAINIETGKRVYMTSSSEAYKLMAGPTNKPGGHITAFSMGKLKTLWGWRLATEEEIKQFKKEE